MGGGPRAFSPNASPPVTVGVGMGGPFEKAALLAKIEKPSAVARLPEIVEACDAVMVARGDLGVDLPPQSVPPLHQFPCHSCVVILASDLTASNEHSCARHVLGFPWLHPAGLSEGLSSLPATYHAVAASRIHPRCCLQPYVQ